MALSGSAPKFMAKLNRSGVPSGGIKLTDAVAFLGVILNAIVPAQALEIVLNMAVVGIIASWGMIVLSQLALFRLAKKGQAIRSAFRMIGAPYTSYLTLAFLLAVLVLTVFDSPVGIWTIGSVVAIVPALIIGWHLSLGRINEIAAARDSDTHGHPVKAHHAGAGE